MLRDPSEPIPPVHRSLQEALHEPERILVIGTSRAVKRSCEPCLPQKCTSAGHRLDRGEECFEAPEEVVDSGTLRVIDRQSVLGQLLPQDVL